MDEKKHKYFDLQLSGIGYLNRAREVKPQEGNPYLAVNLSFLSGKEGKVKYVNAQTIVVGREAKELVQQHQERINDRESKVLVTCRVGDIRPDSWDGPKNGSSEMTRYNVIKGRLLQITLIRIDGEEVYRTTAKESEEAHNTAAKDSGDSADETPTANNLPERVELRKEDENFEETRKRLKADGYRWNPGEKAWVLPKATA